MEQGRFIAIFFSACGRGNFVGRISRPVQLPIESWFGTEGRVWRPALRKQVILLVGRASVTSEQRHYPSLACALYPVKPGCVVVEELAALGQGAVADNSFERLHPLAKRGGARADGP